MGKTKRRQKQDAKGQGMLTGTEIARKTILTKGGRINLMLHGAKHNKADTHTVDLKRSTQGGEEKGNEDFSMRYRYTMEHGFTVIHK